MLKQCPELDVVFHALADPSRRSIVERLSLGSATVTDLAAPLPMSMPAVLQHLQVLEDNGLLRARKGGRVRTGRVGVKGLQPAARWGEGRRCAWGGRPGRPGGYLGGDPGGAQKPP